MLLKVLLLILFMGSPVIGTASRVLAEQASPNLSVQQIIIRVDGASCPFCAFGLEKRLRQIEGVVGVQIEMKEGKAIVSVKKGATISEQALREAIADAGFTPREILFPPNLSPSDGVP